MEKERFCLNLPTSGERRDRQILEEGIETLVSEGDRRETLNTEGNETVIESGDLEETTCGASSSLGKRCQMVGPHPKRIQLFSGGGETSQMIGPTSKRIRSLSGGPSSLEPLPDCKKDLILHGEDDYDHVECGLVYVVTSYPGAGIPEDLHQDQIQGCECIGVCTEDCKCCVLYGSPYQEGKLKECQYKNPIFECNDLCNCSDECVNRIVQKGPIRGLKISTLDRKGYGVTTSCFVPRNSFVCEYAGEYISPKEAQLRFSRQSDESSNYILVLREHTRESAAAPYVTVIDPTVVGNIGRYVNHSCDPNLVVVPVRINSVHPLAALFALRDIFPGEELCYDYSNTMSRDDSLGSLSVGKAKSLGWVGAYAEPQVYVGNVDTGEKVNTLSTAGEVINIRLEENLGTESSTGKLETSVIVRGKNIVDVDEPNARSTCPRLKQCLCNSKNCRKFLPSDKDII